MVLLASGITAFLLPCWLDASFDTPLFAGFFADTAPLRFVFERADLGFSALVCSVFDGGRGSLLAFKYRYSTLSLAHGVFRRKDKLDLMLGSWVKQRRLNLSPNSSQPNLSTRYVKTVSSLMPCKGLFCWLIKMHVQDILPDCTIFGSDLRHRLVVIVVTNIIINEADIGV